MGFLDYLLKSRNATASVAKERLSIIVAREGFRRNGAPHYLPQLKQELLQVLAKYEKIDLEQVTVNVGKDGDTDVLELNVVLSPAALAERAPPPAMPRRPAAAGIAPAGWWER
jgi:cell division topological specificity factor